jgi:membrane fusion protein (multidrug efflux system)
MPPANARAFYRSLRFLQLDGFRGWMLSMIVILGLLGAWTAWFCLARLSLWVASEKGRLEVEKSIYPVEAPVNGQVLRSHLVLGRQTKAGEILVELEGESQRLELRQEQARLAMLTAQLDQLDKEARAEAEVEKDEQQRDPLLIQEARAKYEEAMAASRFSGEEARRLERLHANGLLPELEYLRARSEAQKREATARELQLAIDRIGWDQKTHSSEHRVTEERLNREVARIRGEVGTSHSIIQRLEYELERQIIRAPVTGQLGEAAPLRPGSFLRSGERIAALVPAGGLRAVAYFNPGQSLGRLQSGQRARIRLESFPWTAYGSIQAVVSSVASEIRDGLIRVEFSIQPDPGSRIPLQHGLPGSVEVEVERISPAQLLLRMVGKQLDEAAARPNHLTGGN